MEIFLNVPEGFREFKILNSSEDNNPLLKIKGKRHAKNLLILKISFVIIFIHYLRLIIVSL